MWEITWSRSIASRRLLTNYTRSFPTLRLWSRCNDRRTRQSREAREEGREEGGREMTWSIQTVVSLGAVAKIFIAIIVAALAYLVYKASKKGSAKSRYSRRQNCRTTSTHTPRGIRRLRISNDHPNDVDKSKEDIRKEMLYPSSPFRNVYVQSGLPLWLSIRRGQRVWTHASGSRRLEHARGLHPRRKP